MKREYEPTISDVMDVMVAGFNRFEARFDQVDERLENLETSMTTVQWRLGNLEVSMLDVERRVGNLEISMTGVQQRLGNVEVSMTDVQRRLGNLEISMVDTQETLHSLSEAEGKDAIATINHEKRIQVLEKRDGIKSKAPGHLRVRPV